MEHSAQNRNSPICRGANCWMLLFWPVYLLRYLLVEALNPAAVYIPIWTPLDDCVPFCEWFLIPYVLWYGAIVGLHLYTLAVDVESFKRYTLFLGIAIGISTTVFLLFPTCQNLRPAEFPRDNPLTRAVGLLYRIDTNTNVLPSEHVIGAVGLFLGVWNTPRLIKPVWIVSAGIFSLLVCLATLFLKQHSVLDLLAAVPVCVIAGYIAWGRRGRSFGKR